MLELEIWVKVDTDGNYVIATGSSGACEKYTEEFTEDGPTRLVGITVKVPTPKAVEAVVVCPEEPADAAVSVK